MSNKNTIIVLGFVAPLLVAMTVYGYAFYENPEPLRVLFNADAGTVVFEHATHSKMNDVDCAVCHHNIGEAKTKIPDELKGKSHEKQGGACRDCHYSNVLKSVCEDDPTHKSCIGKKCTSCHLSDGENCKLCHN